MKASDPTGFIIPTILFCYYQMLNQEPRLELHIQNNISNNYNLWTKISWNHFLFIPPRQKFTFYCTVWKLRKFTPTEKIFRQNTYLVISLLNLLLSQNFCQNCAGVNSRNFHTVYCTVEKHYKTRSPFLWQNRQYFVKWTVLLKNLLKRWFHKIFNVIATVKIKYKLNWFHDIFVKNCRE